MALSGSVTTSSSSGRSVTLNWSATQSIANNTSTVSWTLVGSGSASGWVRVSELRVTINGTQVYYRGSSNHTDCYNGTQLASGSTTISHNSDGTKSFSISVEAGIYQWAINCSGSGTFTLNTIARASSITSASSITLGNACSVKWTPASSSFKYKIKFALGSWSYTTGYISPGITSAYTYTGYTIPVSVANYITSATTGTMTAYLYTYNGTTQIGSTSSKTFTVTVPSSVIPTISSFSVAVDNSANSVIAGWGLYVAGYSKAKLTTAASGSYSSTISSFTISGAYSATKSGTSLSYTGSTLTSSGTKTFSVVAKDSRGRSSASSSKSVTVYAYSKPAVSSFTAARSTSDATKMIVKANWTFASVNSKNSATGTLYYKLSTSSSWTTYGTISKNTTTTLTGTFAEDHSYDFRVIVKDAVGNSTQKDVFVSTIEVLLDFRAGGKGLGIGKIAETDSMEVALASNFYAKMSSEYSDIGFYASNTTTGYKVGFGVGIGGYNRGIYDSTDGSWIIYRNSENATVTVTSSDERLKNDLGEIPTEETVALLSGIVPHNFTYKNSKAGVVHNGFMAQNVRDVLAENGIGYRSYLIIGEDNYDLNTPDDDITYGLDYSKFTPLLLSGWQYHESKLDELAKRIDALEASLEREGS